MKSLPVILVTGACGQLGSEMVKALRRMYGHQAVIAADAVMPFGPYLLGELCCQLDVGNKKELESMIYDHKVTQIYHLADEPDITGLLRVLEMARIYKLDKVFWPGSISVFGRNLPHGDCPQHTVTQPASVQGIHKLAGEQWCRYYFEQYGLDVRSLRYPGLVSDSPGGGLTDYVREVFEEAITHNAYTCFLAEHTRLPVLYIGDAVHGAMQLMEAPAKNIRVRSSYNISGMSFTPAELALAIREELPGFRMEYVPDARQLIADSWPERVDDLAARYDWDWKPAYNLKRMTKEMFIKEKTDA